MARVLLSSVTFCSILLLTVAWDLGHDLNLEPKHSIIRRSANINYTNILNFRKDHQNELQLHGEHKEVVLVIGNTGSGKTTLISALVGRTLNVTQFKDQAYLVIVDKEKKIGTGTSSTTLIPEIMIDGKRNVTYVDCPGFRDNRDIKYEISSIYFQNIFMRQIKKIKLVLVINYESCKISGNKNDFDDLLKHMSEFIKDISKFHDGIALVVTKVENIFEYTEDGRRILLNDNQSVLNSIASFLRHKKDIYSRKTEDAEKYKSFIGLIDILLQENNGIYTRIAIFRQPTVRGSLKKSKTAMNEMDIVAKTIKSNLNYVDVEIADFGFALSEPTKNTVEQIIGDIFQNSLVDRLHKMGNETLMHYLQMEMQYNDIEILREKISRAHHAFSKMTKVDQPLQLFQDFLDATNILNISVSLSNLNIISEDIKTLQFFVTVSNNNETLHMLLLKSVLQDVINLIESIENFYDFLNNLQTRLAAYHSQRFQNDERINQIMTSCRDQAVKTTLNIAGLESIVKEIGSDDAFQKVKNSEINRFQLRNLAAVFKAFTTQLEFSCTPSSGRMVVKGYNIKMNDVIKNNCWTQAKIIHVFALNKVFIDCTIDKTGAEVQLFIFAPTWEVFGDAKIILDGIVGSPHKSPSAKSSSFVTENGSNGSPGLPGGPAGHFFGVGKQMISLENLEIRANGGKGGPGQNGGNGADGIQGEELPESFYSIDRDHKNAREYLKNHDFHYSIRTTRNELTYWVNVTGKPAVKPSDGGNGGVGGEGGYPGRIVINNLGNLVKFKTSNYTGPTGLDGLGGHGGKKASNGRNVHIIHGKNYWEWEYGRDNLQYGKWWSDNGEVPAGKDGNSGNNKIGQKHSKELSLESPYHAINSFKNFVHLNLYKNIKESNLKTFISELENNDKIKVEYNTFAFVDELQGLENQFLQLKNKINFVPFYNSFLSRIEEYAKSEVISENKKVLAYLYTAGLTKVFTLKQKRKGQTVVDLYKYLNIIETSIRDIKEAQYLQTVQNYRNDYNKTIWEKIREAEYYIQEKVEPEIDQLWEKSDHQLKAIVDEIKENKNSTEDTLVSLEKRKKKVRDMIALRGGLLSLKLIGASLSFFGPIGAGVGVAVTSATSIAEGMTLDTTSALGQNKLYSLDPNLKVMSRVTETYNNKQKLVTDKLHEAMTKLEKYEDEILALDKDKPSKKRTINKLRTRLQEAMFKKTSSISDILQKHKDIQEIEKKLAEFTESEKDLLEKKKEQEKNVKDLKKERKYETSLRRINDVQTILNSAEIIFTFIKKNENDEGIINDINDQMSECTQQLKSLEKMDNQLLDIMIPDLRQIENDMNTIRTSINGSSHAKLDISKWNVRTTLKDVKSLIQKFTHKMSFELRSNLERYLEKIDEGFSILIDIYDRIDSYSDSVKQAEYMAHIVSASIDDVQVTNSELSKAFNDLKLIIHSNILIEKYEIALHAFKQHYFPFAAHFLQKFQLPTDIRPNNTETWKFTIIERIKNMKNYIDESEAQIGEYNKYIHDKKIFSSDSAGSSSFYVWKHDAIKDEIQQLFNGSEILLKADISKGLFLNSVKYTDIGINFKLENKTLQNHLDSVLTNYVLTLTMIGNNYYRCGERYYFISFDDDITISYVLNQDKNNNWIDPNKVYSTIRSSHPFLSPYAMWSIKLKNINEFASFNDLNGFVNEKMDMELFGKGSYIEQNINFNFEVCNDYLNSFYDVENIVKEIV